MAIASAVYVPEKGAIGCVRRRRGRHAARQSAGARGPADRLEGRLTAPSPRGRYLLRRQPTPSRRQPRDIPPPRRGSWLERLPGSSVGMATYSSAFCSPRLAPPSRPGISPAAVADEGREQHDRDLDRLVVVETLQHHERAPRPEVDQVAGDGAEQASAAIGGGVIARVPGEERVRQRCSPGLPRPLGGHGHRRCIPVDRVQLVGVIPNQPYSSPKASRARGLEARDRGPCRGVRPGVGRAQWAMQATNTASRSAKWRYTVRRVTPASSAMPAIDVWEGPTVVCRRTAASVMRSRV